VLDEYAKESDVDRDTEQRKPIARLTTRDKELLAHVATARYLTLPQLKKIAFVRPSGEKREGAGTRRAGPSDAVCKRRLTRLCQADPAYLRRLRYRDREDADVAVYATAALGQVVAQQVLGRAPRQPSQDPKPQFLEHTVVLNDLYVALTEACVRQQLPTPTLPFLVAVHRVRRAPVAGAQHPNGSDGRASDRS